MSHHRVHRSESLSRRLAEFLSLLAYQLCRLIDYGCKAPFTSADMHANELQLNEKLLTRWKLIKAIKKVVAFFENKQNLLLQWGSPLSSAFFG